MIEILLADDHAVVRHGIQQIINSAYSQAVFGEACSLHELRQFISAGHWDALILDLAFPDGNALEILKQIKRDFPHLPVLILSMYPEEQYALRAIRAGASGYLNKESAPEELVEAMQKILSGGEYISAIVAEQLLHYARHSGDQPLHASLSDREYQVLCLIALGKELREISLELSLSPKTVSTYRTRLLTKMNMKSNAELVRYAIQYGLLMKDA
jgi:two-component system invasion response regulator UvrY